MEVYDIETLKPLFLYEGWDIDKDIWFEYEISAYRNDLYGLVKHLLDGGIDYMISFNGNGFDFQVLQFILDNYKRWVELTNLEIVGIIYTFSQKVIDDQKYGLFPPYREENFKIKQIDLFKIHHYDNEARRTSLKWLEFTMDAPDVEEMPIHHSVLSLTKEEIEEIKVYCRTDVRNTRLFLRFTVGDTDHEVYKGVNKIQDRLDLIEEMDFSDVAMNYSDVKIGDEINKSVYLKNAGITKKQLKELLETRKSRAGFTYGDCIPKYVEFQTLAFQEFFERMKLIRVNLNETEEYTFEYNKTRYLVAKGGIHSNEKNRIVIRKTGWLLLDADIGSQYPWSIIKRKLYPYLLGLLWLVGYRGTFDKRFEYKPLGKTIRKYKGLADMLKLALNGGGFGKTNDRSNWQYDPFVQFSCTIGNQFEILMLIEALEVKGIHVISANTDGIVCYFPEELQDIYYEVCKWWERKVGNDEQGKLEYTHYDKLIQGSVNDYIAIETNGKVKKKGDFSTTFELHKNPSRRIIAIAIEKYFTENISIKETITKHRRIYDFCIGVKASKNYHYETNNSGGGKEIYNRLVRYYISTNGEKLYKVKNDGAENAGVERSQCDAGPWKCTVANKIIGEKDIEEYHINYEYYIQKAEERISALESGRKKKGGTDNPNQQSLF